MSLQKMTWNIEGQLREAQVSFSIKENSPLLFAFHGHGGTALGFSKNKFDVLSPETTVIYPQGLLTASPADNLGSKTGWQHGIGEVNNTTHLLNQDLKFFDAMLESMINQFTCNPSLVFLHGWSNGGEFIYDVLWSARGDKIAAISCASAILNTTNNKKPLSVLHIAGKNDPVVAFEAQKKSMQNIYTLNQCREKDNAWAIDDNGIIGIRRWSPIYKPAFFLEHDGGHEYPSNVPYWIVKYYKNIMWRLQHTE